MDKGSFKFHEFPGFIKTLIKHWRCSFTQLLLEPCAHLAKFSVNNELYELIWSSQKPNILPYFRPQPNSLKLYYTKIISVWSSMITAMQNISWNSLLMTAKWHHTQGSPLTLTNIGNIKTCSLTRHISKKHHCRHATELAKRPTVRWRIFSSKAYKAEWLTCHLLDISQFHHYKPLFCKSQIKKAQLSQRNRMMLCVTKYFAKSLKVIQSHSKWHSGVGRM